MNIAIITGASSGLGKEFFFNIAQRYPNLDEIWLIARRKDRLEKLAEIYKTKKIVVLPLDLSENDSYAKLQKLLIEKKPQINVLINNAGFGKLGNVAKANYISQSTMVDLNCKALVAITTICIPYIIYSGFIINVCSIASFAPTPRMTVYSATKAFALCFSRSLREELTPLGINALAVCPGPMKTEFLDVANIDNNSKPFQNLPYCNPKDVAAKAIEKAEKGRAFHTNKLIYKFYRLIAKTLPHNLVMKFSKT